MKSSKNLVEVRDLIVQFRSAQGVSCAVDEVSFSLAPGETLGIVGESGCGKSVTALSIMRLVPRPAGEIVAGQVFFQGENLLDKSEREMRRIRGKQISMIFQEPMTSLNPMHTVGDQIIEGILCHKNISKEVAKEEAIEMLRMVGIPSPERRLHDFPHQLSGGMNQRVMIAMALTCNPKLLIADEPTTALDVTIQAQILDLMRDLRERTGTAIILITHDLAVVAELAHRVVVMYAGRIIEEADVEQLFSSPEHPYTVGLLGSIPRLYEEEDRLFAIDGTVPSPEDMPVGCHFHPRCPLADDVCRQQAPPLNQVTPAHRVACWKAPVAGKSVAVK